MITIASKGVLQEGELQSYAGLGPRQKPFANSCTRLAAQGVIKVDRSVAQHAWPGAQHVAQSCCTTIVIVIVTSKGVVSYR